MYDYIIAGLLVAIILLVHQRGKDNYWRGRNDGAEAVETKVLDNAYSCGLDDHTVWTNLLR